MLARLGDAGKRDGVVLAREAAWCKDGDRTMLAI